MAEDQHYKGRENLLSSNTYSVTITYSRCSGSEVSWFGALQCKWKQHFSVWNGPYLAFQNQPWESFQQHSMKCVLPSQDYQQCLIPRCYLFFLLAPPAPITILFFQIFQYLCYQFPLMYLNSFYHFYFPYWTRTDKVLIRGH